MKKFKNKHINIIVITILVLIAVGGYNLVNHDNKHFLITDNILYENRDIDAKIL